VHCFIAFKRENISQVISSIPDNTVYDAKKFIVQSF